jgi:hypothetical protein
MGGLGLFDLRSFLDAQKIAWIKRAKSLDDWWKISLYSRCYGTVFNIRSTDFDARCVPCLHTIVTGYENLMFNLTKKNENFRDAFLYRNKALTVGIRDSGLLDESKFTIDFFNTYGYMIKNLRICDIYSDNNYVGLNVFRINTNIPISLPNYQMLKGIAETALVRYRKTLPEHKPSVDVVTFVNRSKRGSKRFRNILIPCSSRVELRKPSLTTCSSGSQMTTILRFHGKSFLLCLTDRHIYP